MPPVADSGHRTRGAALRTRRERPAGTGCEIDPDRVLPTRDDDGLLVDPREVVDRESQELRSADPVERGTAVDGVERDQAAAERSGDVGEPFTAGTEGRRERRDLSTDPDSGELGAAGLPGDTLIGHSRALKGPFHLRLGKPVRHRATREPLPT